MVMKVPLYYIVCVQRGWRSLLCSVEALCARQDRGNCFYTQTHQKSLWTASSPHSFFISSCNIITVHRFSKFYPSNRMSVRLCACCASTTTVSSSFVLMRWLLRSMIVMMITMVVVAERVWWNRPSELLVFISWEIYVRSLA